MNNEIVSHFNDVLQNADIGLELVVVKKFTDWMNEGFNGTYLKHDPAHSSQFTKRLKLADGSSLSIQAGYGHYCLPRMNSDTGDYDFYSSFEIGYPSVEIKEIMEFAEQPECPTDTVYGYVPKQVIQAAIDARGGVVGFDVKEQSK